MIIAGYAMAANTVAQHQLQRHGDPDGRHSTRSEAQKRHQKNGKQAEGAV